jgi:hypothetical protein
MLEFAASSVAGCEQSVGADWSVQGVWRFLPLSYEFGPHRSEWRMWTGSLERDEAANVASTWL